ncbi:hypothetical protein CMV_024226 [Castanea mollissima]|uniref:Protein kinase domain-containing protein n=1 Tax=Castanea mollissima TaxID=60419 RepID=A0A8J4QNG2_9ROSI|nr:hypothetical protein CMV_024226 [Castanea mollissima]
MAVTRILLWSFSFILALLCSSAQIQNSTTKLGSSITAGSDSSWKSPSGDFAFGFYPLVTNQYLVGIWFDKISEKALVWSANRDDPADLARIQQTDADLCKKEVMDDCFCVAAVFNRAIAIYHHPLAQRYMRVQLQPPPKRKPVEINLKAYSFQDLQEATNGFKNMLGQGAFGTVYSGVLTLEDEEVEVAVKKLEKVIERGEKEFLTEVQVIGLTHHKNLVRLKHMELHPADESMEVEYTILTDWVLSCVRAGNLEATVSHDSELLSDYKRFERMALVGVWCIMF